MAGLNCSYYAMGAFHRKGLGEGRSLRIFQRMSYRAPKLRGILEEAYTDLTKTGNPNFHH